MKTSTQNNQTEPHARNCQQPQPPISTGQEINQERRDASEQHDTAPYNNPTSTSVSPHVSISSNNHTVQAILQHLLYFYSDCRKYCRVWVWGAKVRRVEWRKNVGRNVELILGRAVGCEECLLGTSVEDSKGCGSGGSMASNAVSH